MDVLVLATELRPWPPVGGPRGLCPTPHIPSCALTPPPIYPLLSPGGDQQVKATEKRRSANQRWRQRRPERRLVGRRRAGGGRVGRLHGARPAALAVEPPRPGPRPHGLGESRRFRGGPPPSAAAAAPTPPPAVAPQVRLVAAKEELPRSVPWRDIQGGGPAVRVVSCRAEHSCVVPIQSKSQRSSQRTARQSSRRVGRRRSSFTPRSGGESCSCLSVTVTVG